MVVLVLLSVIGLSSGATILEYKDPENGIHHVQTGEPGEKVEGSFAYNAPDGDAYRLTYNAGLEGFEAAGSHLPVVPEDTAEVTEAKSKFSEAFKNVESRADEMAVETYAQQIAFDLISMEELAAEVNAAKQLAAEALVAEKLVADELVAEKLVADELAAEGVLAVARRKRSPVTVPLIKSSIAAAPLSSVHSFRQPLTYLTTSAGHYPTSALYASAYPLTFAVNQPFYTYPIYNTKTAVSDEPSMQEMAEEEEKPIYEAPTLPTLSVDHPIVRINFPFNQPIRSLPVQPIQPLQPLPVPVPVQDTIRVGPTGSDDSSKGIVQQGDDEAAALAL